MSREVVWTRSRFTLVCEQGMLNSVECDVLEMHIIGRSNLEIAVKHNCDISCINAYIRKFKMIYDALVIEFPDILEPRNKSVYRKKKHSN